MVAAAMAWVMVEVHSAKCEFAENAKITKDCLIKLLSNKKLKLWELIH